MVLASSVCPLMEEAKRFVQTSWWEGLAVGKTESSSGKQLSKALIQLSANGWGSAPYLVVFWPETTQYGLLAGLMVTSMRIYTKGYLPRLLLPVPVSLSWAPAGPRVHRRPSTIAGSFGSVSCGVTAAFLWVLVYARFCSCPLSLGVSISPILWNYCNKIPLSFKDRFLWDPQYLCRIPRLGSLTWSSEALQQWKNFFGIISLQFVNHPYS